MPRPSTRPADHKPSTHRTADGRKLHVTHDAQARTVRVALHGEPRATTVLLDSEADEYAAAVATFRHFPLGAGTVTFTRDQAHRLARQLRKHAHPLADFEQEYGEHVATSCRAVVRRYGVSERGPHERLPATGRQALRVVRRAARFALQRPWHVDPFHDRINHTTGRDRACDAQFIRLAGRRFTLGEVCRLEHFPF